MPVAFGVVQDVTDEWSAKRALADQLAFIEPHCRQCAGRDLSSRAGAHGFSSVNFLESSYEVLGVRAREVMAIQRRFFLQHSSGRPERTVGADQPRRAGRHTLRTSLRVLLPRRGQRWIQVDASARVDGDGEMVWHGYLSDVTDSLKASKALERQRMLQAIQASQAMFIGVDDKRKAFEGLLASFLGSPTAPMVLWARCCSMSKGSRSCACRP
ncbi:MAG: hypothetical protein R3E42_12475 [Burkholderiaceae bacterium]